MTPSMKAAQILIDAERVSHQIGEGDIPREVRDYVHEAITRAIWDAEEEADKWRQIAEATEITKQGLYQDIESLRAKHADLLRFAGRGTGNA